MYSGKRFLLKIKNNKSLFINKRFKNTVFSDSVIIRWSYKQYYIYVDVMKYCTVESHLSELLSLMMKFYFFSIDSMHCCQSNSLIWRYTPIIWRKNHRLLGRDINKLLFILSVMRTVCLLMESDKWTSTVSRLHLWNNIIHVRD